MEVPVSGLMIQSVARSRKEMKEIKVQVGMEQEMSLIEKGESDKVTFSVTLDMYSLKLGAYLTKMISYRLSEAEKKKEGEAREYSTQWFHERGSKPSFAVKSTCEYAPRFILYNYFSEITLFFYVTSFLHSDG